MTDIETIEALSAPDFITSRPDLEAHLRDNPLEPAWVLTPCTMVAGVVRVAESLLEATDAGQIARGLETALAGFGEGQISMLRSGLALALAACDCMLLEG